MAEPVITQRVALIPVNPDDPEGDVSLVFPESMIKRWPQRNFRDVSIVEGEVGEEDKKRPTYVITPLVDKAL